MTFNLSQFKAARRGSEPPEVFTRPFFRRERDAYDLVHLPGDGKGYKLTTPYSEGLPGHPPDVGSPAGGSRGRDGSPEPDDFSEFSTREDRDVRDPNKIMPHDTEPDQPFGEIGVRYDQYGEGTQTPYGSAGHDAPPNDRSDSAVSIERTVQRDMGPGGFLDRPPAINSMTPYNSMHQKDDTPLRRVRRLQRS